MPYYWPFIEVYTGNKSIKKKRNIFSINAHLIRAALYHSSLCCSLLITLIYYKFKIRHAPIDLGQFDAFVLGLEKENGFQIQFNV